MQIEDKVKVAIDELISTNESDYKTGVSGLYNPIYKSKLVIRNVEIKDRKATIHPDDYLHCSYLVLGLTIKNHNLHVVCGIGDNKLLWIITLINL